MNEKIILSKSETDLQRLERSIDEDIDLSDCPEITSEQFAKAVVRQGLPVNKNKAQVTLRIDSDVLDWFKSQGRGYQTQINSLLRAYKDAHHRSLCDDITLADQSTMPSRFKSPISAVINSINTRTLAERYFFWG
jgi:uncharacterized protein (DUF4415 family)